MDSVRISQDALASKNTVAAGIKGFGDSKDLESHEDFSHDHNPVDNMMEINS